jgi:hypothetical protein
MLLKVQRGEIAHDEPPVADLAPRSLAYPSSVRGTNRERHEINLLERAFLVEQRVYLEPNLEPGRS